jgi:hypothetical protein
MLGIIMMKKMILMAIDTPALGNPGSSDSNSNGPLVHYNSIMYKIAPFSQVPLARWTYIGYWL